MEALALLTSDQAKNLLDQVVQETFESIFFVEAASMPSENIDKINGADGLEVEIDIKCKFSGNIKMYLSTESAKYLAGLTMLEPGEIDESVLSDVFSEILNTIAGRVAASLANSSYSFDLSIPNVSFKKIQFAGKAQVKTCYQVEHGCICFAFYLSTL